MKLSAVVELFEFIQCCPKQQGVLWQFNAYIDLREYDCPTQRSWFYLVNKTINVLETKNRENVLLHLIELKPF